MNTTELVNLAAATAGVFAVALGAWNAWHAQATKLAVSELRHTLFERLAQDRANLLQHLASDKEDLRSWVNGSFMRASEVLARLEGLEARLG